MTPIGASVATPLIASCDMLSRTVEKQPATFPEKDEEDYKKKLQAARGAKAVNDLLDLLEEVFSPLVPRVSPILDAAGKEQTSVEGETIH